MKYYNKIFPGLYISSYGAIGAVFPLIAQYLHSIGFTGTQIGVITASSTAIGIISNSFWGNVYHAKQKNKMLIVFLCIVTALLSLFLMVTGNFWVFLILYIIVFFFENPIYPLIDSAVLEVEYPFGPARKWGAVGFAMGIGVAGTVADRFGLISIFPMFAGFFLVSAVLLGLFYMRLGREVNLTKNHKNTSSTEKATEKSPGGSYKDLLSNKKYVALLASAFFFNGPSLAHNTYFSFLYIDSGGTIAGMGLVLLLMVISEAPVMGFSERITAAITMERAILAAMAVSALRFLWYSTNPSSALLGATFFVQGIANGIALVELVKYIMKIVGVSMLSLALPLFTAVSSNCGAIACQFFGGVIVDYLGSSGVYLFYGILNCVGIGIFIISGLHRSQKITKTLAIF